MNEYEPGPCLPLMLPQKRILAELVQLVKNLPANTGDIRGVGLIPGLRFPGEGNGNPLQYSCLENSMDRGDWYAIGHGVAENRTCLSTHTHTHTHTLSCWLAKNQDKN